MTDAKATLLSFLASPAAPRTTLSPLELDGYLTGVIVTPQSTPILPSQWLPGLWGDEEPIFDDDAQIEAMLGAVMEYYNALIADIDRGLKRLESDGVADYRPMFLTGGAKPAHEAVRRWVRGFWKAMALAPAVWRALAEDERTQILIQPLVRFSEFEDQKPVESPDNIEDLLDEHAALIPRTILVLHKLARIRSADAHAAPDRRSKVGRNDPCPCGSGQKYKRCCGRNVQPN